MAVVLDFHSSSNIKTDEDERIDEKAAELGEEAMEFTYTIRELGAEMILGGA